MYPVASTAYLNFCSGRILKGLGLGTYVLGLKGSDLCLDYITDCSYSPP